MQRLVLLTLFFLSGSAGLIYQLLWVRRFSFMLGSAYLTISIVVVAYMLGLLAGAWWIGRRVAAIKNPVCWYGWLEVFVGLAAGLFVFFTPGMEKIFGAVHSLFHEAAGWRTAFSALLVLLFLLPFTAAMGATLPLLADYFTRKNQAFFTNLRVLYAINTFGAAAGVLATGFYLIEFLGVENSLLLAAAMNLLLGSVALIFFREAATIPVTLGDGETARSSREKNENGQLIFYAAFLSGFTALAYEILWTRALKFLIQSSTYSFAIILFVYLLGIAAGSWWSERLAGKKKNLWRFYGRLQLVLGVAVLFSLVFLYRIANTDFFREHILNTIFNYSRSWVSGILVYALVCALVFLAATLLMGALYPVLNQLHYNSTNQSPGQTVSRVYTVNTAGGIAGALAAAFALIPLLGLRGSILGLSLIQFTLGYLFLRKSGGENLWRWFTAGAAAVLCIGFAFSERYLYSREERNAGKVAWYREGLNATVKVYETGKHLHLGIDGMNIASTSPALLQKEFLIAHLPFFLRQKMEAALVVGLASGISTGAIAVHAPVKRVDCVELISPVFDASRFFSEYNRNVLQNPKVNFYHNDVYAFLKFSDRKYDVISSDGKLGTLDHANTTMLSSDYYDECRRHLNKDGIFIQWIPLITPAASFEVIANTMKKSFAHVGLFYFYPYDVMMVGSSTPVVLDYRWMNQVMQQPQVKADLQSIGLSKASEIMCSYIGEFSLTNEKPLLNSMNSPVLEFWFYRDWKRGEAIAGGYRAANLAFLNERFKRQRSEAGQVFLQLPRPEWAAAIHSSSSSFFDFCIDNFKSGSFESGQREYEQFKRSIPF